MLDCFLSNNDVKEEIASIKSTRPKIKMTSCRTNDQDAFTKPTTNKVIKTQVRFTSHLNRRKLKPSQYFSFCSSINSVAPTNGGLTAPQVGVLIDASNTVYTLPQTTNVVNAAVLPKLDATNGTAVNLTADGTFSGDGTGLTNLWLTFEEVDNAVTSTDNWLFYLRSGNASELTNFNNLVVAGSLVFVTNTAAKPQMKVKAAGLELVGGDGVASSSNNLEVAGSISAGNGFVGDGSGITNITATGPYAPTNSDVTFNNSVFVGANVTLGGGGGAPVAVFNGPVRALTYEGNGQSLTNAAGLLFADRNLTGAFLSQTNNHDGIRFNSVYDTNDYTLLLAGEFGQPEIQHFTNGTFSEMAFTFSTPALSSNCIFRWSDLGIIGVKTNFTGDASGLTNLQTTNLVGTLPTNTLPGQLSDISTGNGWGLTNLNSTNLTGTIADARLSVNVPLTTGSATFTGFIKSQTTDPYFQLTDTTSGADDWQIYDVDGVLSFRNVNKDTYVLRLATNGNATFSGTVTATNGMASPYACLIQSTNWTRTISTQDVYYPMTDMNYSAGFRFGLNPASGIVTNLAAGDYKIFFQASYTGQNAHAYESALFTNGVECPLIEFKRTMGAAAAIGSASASGVIYLPANTVIDVRIQDTSGTGDATFSKYQFTIGMP